MTNSFTTPFLTFRTFVKPASWTLVTRVLTSCWEELIKFLQTSGDFLFGGAADRCGHSWALCWLFPQIQHELCLFLLSNWRQDENKAVRWGTPLKTVDDDEELLVKGEEDPLLAAAMNECSMRRAASIALSSCVTWWACKTRCWVRCGCNLEINWEVTYVGQDFVSLSPSYQVDEKCSCI